MREEFAIEPQVTEWTPARIVAALLDVPAPRGCQRVLPAPLCNPAFPGTFNLSLTEPEMLQEYGDYLDITHDLIYTKVQPCIRFNDWQRMIKADPLGNQDRLLLFHMADVGGIQVTTRPADAQAAIRHSIQSLCRFLTGRLRLDPTRIRFKTLAGRFTVRVLSEGRYDLDDSVPPFDALEETLGELGYDEANLIPDNTRDTFLCARVFGHPTPWGYRSEVLYDTGNSLLDIGTIQLLTMRPEVIDGRVRGLKPWEHSLALAAIGVERVAGCAISSGTQPCTTFYSHLLEHIKMISSRFDAATALKFIHATVAICALLPELSTVRESRHRNRKYASLITTLLGAAGHLDFELSPTTIRELVEEVVSLPLLTTACSTSELAAAFSSEIARRASVALQEENSG